MRTADWGVTILRVVVGIVFAMHGGQKLFVYGFAGTGQAMERMGIPLAPVAGVVVTLVEFLGGILLIAGLATRWAAALLAIDMLVATLRVHLGAGFFLPRGFEYALTMLAANLALALCGPGALALDARIAKRR